MSVIIYDTETTGLLAPKIAGQEYQPYLIEFYAIKYPSYDHAPIEKLHFRCKPPGAILPAAIKIHGITNSDVADCEPFIAWYPKLAEFFLNCKVSAGNNIMFDKMILFWELNRIGKEYNFPWPIRDIDTAEICSQQLGFRLNLTDLHTKLFGEPFAGAHSASVDCEMTSKCLREMYARGWVVI